MAGTQSAAPHVFVSYSHTDTAEVQAEVRRLVTAGHRVWYDHGIAPGSDWRDAIAHAIEDACAVLFFASPRAVTSPRCQKELHYAEESGVPVLCVHLEPTRVDGGLGLMLGGEQAVLAWRDAGAAERVDAWLAAHSHATPGTGERIGRFTERRSVAILVCDRMIDPATTQADLFTEHEQKFAFVQLCHRVLEHHEGRIVEALDGRVVALFGFPVSTENNAHRAALAAGALLDAYDAFERDLAGTRTAAGALALLLHVDTIIAGTVEGEVILSGGALRHAVARAASLRLGGLHVTRETRRHFPDPLFVLEATDDPDVLTLEAVESESLRTRRVASISDPQFCGRDHILHDLEARWQRAREERGSTVHLSGPAGIGKSRLVRALRESIKEAHAWFVCTASPLSGDTAFDPFLRMLRRAWYVAEDDPADVLLDKALRGCALAGMAADSVRPVLVDLFVLQGEHLGDLDAETRQDMLFAFFTDWLEGMTNIGPTVLVVEDLHWLDDASRELVEAVSELASELPLLLLLTSRDAVPAGTTLAGSAHCEVLDPLDPQDADTLVRSVLGADGTASQVAQIVRRGDGLPLFLEELAREAPPEVGRTDREADSVPTVLGDLLAARIDALGDDRIIAQTAAALGREVSHTLLVRVVPMTQDALEAALARMMEADVLYRRGIRTRRTFLFRHALLRDAAYDSIPARDRLAIHSRIATAMTQLCSEGGDAGRLDLRPERIGHHLMLAAEHDAAARQYLMAGRTALERAAYGEAEAHLRRAAELLDGGADDAEPELRFMVQVDLFVAVSGSVGYSAPRAQSVLEEADHLRLKLGRPAIAASFMQKLCFLYLQRGDLVSARPVAQSIASMEGEDDPEVHQRAIEAMGAVALLSGDVPEGRRLFDEGVALAREHSDPNDLIDSGVFCLAHRCHAESLMGAFDAAEHTLAELRERVAIRDAPFDQAVALESSGSCAELYGDVDRARDLFQQARLVAEEHHFDIYRDMARVLLGWIRAHQGEAVRGREDIEAALRALDGGRSRRERSRHLSLLADVQQMLGDTVAADATLVQALHMANRYEEAFWRPELLRQRAVLATRHDAFIEHIQAAVAAARTSGAHLLELRALTTWLERDPEAAAVRVELSTLLESLTGIGGARDGVEARRVLGNQDGDPEQ